MPARSSLPDRPLSREIVGHILFLFVALDHFIDSFLIFPSTVGRDHAAALRTELDRVASDVFVLYFAFTLWTFALGERLFSFPTFHEPDDEAADESADDDTSYRIHKGVILID